MNYCWVCGAELDIFGECENCSPIEWCKWCQSALNNNEKCEYCNKKQ